MTRCHIFVNVSWITLFTIGILVTDAKAPQKLLNSIDAKPGELRYQVSLQRNNYHACGGALISELHVLTAAHCFISHSEPYNEGIIVLTGTTSLINGGEKHYAKYVTVHGKYVKGNSKNRWRHDIAVITLATPAFKNAAQAPISLPSSDLQTSVIATVSGWGQMQKGWNGKYPDDLQKSLVTILTENDCNSRTRIFDTQLCGFDGIKTGICSGDSGGPLVYDNEIVGIVSFAASCGIGFPDVYTRVWSYRDFIADAMKRQ